VSPRGVYRFANAAHDPRLAAIAVALGACRFIHYGKPANEARLEAPMSLAGVLTRPRARRTASTMRDNSAPSICSGSRGAPGGCGINRSLGLTFY
jgi:hypothetical protein